MTIIRVDPESIRHYGTQAQSNFSAITTALKRLADDVVDVHYYGPNAVDFKTRCGALTQTFAGQIHTSMSQMAEAVRISTSNIAASLGGRPITIQIADEPVTAPVPTAVDYVDVDTSALEALLPVVRAHFETIRTQLRNNMTNLGNTDWHGNAKNNAVTQVGGFTAGATSACDSAEEELVAFITGQLNAAVLADA